jgi:hypothetical protein
MIPGSPEHKKYRREIARKHRQAHYDKIYARSVTKNLPHKPCEVCGEVKVEAHHHLGYSHPYTVQWLCKKHHEEADTKLAKEGKEG